MHKTFKMQLRARNANKKNKEEISLSSALRTEDGILVYNVMIENLDNDITREQIYKHFKRYGEIKNIEISRGKRRSQTRHCKISFRTPNGAAAMLKTKTKHLCGKRIKIIACPSWEQPFDMLLDLSSKTSSETKVTDTASDMNGRASLLVLNDYCLEVIYDHLDLLHKVRLSLLHPRLEQVFERMVCPKLSSHLVLSQLNNFTMWELRQYFRSAGTKLQSIELPQNYNMTTTMGMKKKPLGFDLITDYCLHIRGFKIIRSIFDYKNLLNTAKSTNIRELELYDCYMMETDLLTICREMPELRSLGLAGNNKIRGLELYRLRKVERLSLCGCEELCSAAFMRACKMMQLRYLDVRYIESLNLNGTDLVRCCSQLETLRLGTYRLVYLAGIERLAKLKHLEIAYSDDVMPSDFYDKLLTKHANTLEVLKLNIEESWLYSSVFNAIAQFRNLRVLWFYCPNMPKRSMKLLTQLTELEELNLDKSTVSSRYLIPVIEACTKLKRISVRDCWAITTNFVRQVIELLEKRQQMSDTTTSTPPLQMLLHSASVSKRFLSDKLCQNVSHLIQFSMENIKPLSGLFDEQSIFDVRKYINIPATCDENDDVKDANVDDYPTDWSSGSESNSESSFDDNDFMYIL